MKVLVCGGRKFGNAQHVWYALHALNEDRGVDQVIHGGTSGADTLAGEWARANGVPERVFRADWARYGRAAGPIRNQEMLLHGKPDLVLAFPGGRGTEDMVDRATQQLVSVQRA